MKILRSVLSAFLVLAGLFCYAQKPVIQYGGIPYYYYYAKAQITPVVPTNTGGAVSTGKFVNFRSALGTLAAVTTDPTGNVYFTETGNNAVKTIPFIGGAPDTLAIGFNQPYGVAADAAGYVYVADYGNHAVKRIRIVGGTVVDLLSGNIAPYGLAIDKWGNLFFTDWISGSVKKIPAGGGAVTTLGSGFDSPTGIALDTAGNVYVADRGHNLIKKIDAGGVVTTLGSGNGNLNGVAVDAAGNVYFSDSNNTTIVEIPKNGGSVVPIGSGFSQPTGLYINEHGNIYVNDSGHQTIKELQATNFDINGKMPVGLNFDFNTGIISGTPAIKTNRKTYSVAAVNASGRSFTNVTIQIWGEQPHITYKTPDIFTVGDAIIPLVPVNTGGPVDVGYSVFPLLPDGLVLDYHTGVISGTPTTTLAAKNFNITGTIEGKGGYTTTINIKVIPATKPVLSYNTPQIYKADTVITPLVPNSNFVAPAGTTKAVTVASGLSNLSNVAVDNSGNIYFSQLLTNTVKKIPAGGGSPVVLASGFSSPMGVAADAQGNVYVADNGNNAVKKIPVGGGAVVSVATGLNGPSGLAADAAGNIYVTNLGNGLVQKIPAGGGSAVTVGPVFQHPTGVAVDGAGNIYVSDSGSNLIQKIPAGSNTATSLSSVNNPSGVAVDVAGNVFYAELNLGNIKELPVSGGAAVTIASGLNSPSGIAIDPKHVIYVNDSNNNAVKEFVPLGGFFIGLPLPAGLNFDYDSGTISGTPLATTPATDYPVVAYNKYGLASAIVNIKTVNGADLYDLHLSAGVLTPVFATTQTNYTAIVPNAIASLQITPFASDAKATITVNGLAVTSGSPSQTLALAEGANVITTVVTAQYATSTRTYTVTVTRAAGNLSTNAALSTLKLNPITTLTAVSGPAYKNYTTNVPNTETSLMVMPTAQDGNATIKVNGVTVVTGTASQAIPLNVGSNVINVIVTAQDGVTTKSYLITATRALPTIATLSNYTLSAGVLSPVFATATTDYTTIVPYATASIQVTPTATDAGAAITVNGAAVASGSASASLPLAEGANAITTVVTAQDGTTTKTYSTTVTRAAAGLSTNALLTTLKVSPSTALTAVSGPGYKNYTTNVPNAEASLTVTPTTQDGTATIKVNGITVASASASQAIPLNVGSNVISVVVTAQDAVTTKSYIITATRAPSGIATLSSLTLSAGSLTPAFAPGTVSYTADIPNTVSSVAITPTTTQAAATVNVNGVPVMSGSASANLPMAVGANIITVAVTAQDGTTVQTYTITVTRGVTLSNNALLTTLKLSPVTTLATATGPGYKNYTTAVPNSETSLKVVPTAQDATATIKVNGVSVASGATSQAVALSVGDNIVTTVVTAQDGVTTKSYIITVTRAAPGMAAQYEQPTTGLPADGITVRQGVSPNGDGNNDVLTIDGITNYPDNNISIMSGNGVLVFEAKGYNNTSVAFDGHSGKNGRLQPAGTYFYKLDYKDGAEAKTKTGFILLKY